MRFESDHMKVYPNPKIYFIYFLQDGLSDTYLI